MYQLNDDFNKEIDLEMDALKKKNMFSNEKLLEKILNMNLDSNTSDNVDEKLNLDIDDKDPMEKKTSDRRKRNLNTKSESITAFPALTNNKNRRFSEFTDVFEEMDKISRNISTSNAIS